ncbi:MAG: tRNA pseudouridine(38-40) synthase TruA [Acidobacteria bacterium]|nr:tRNA pseudouridine(38-40) synthase TruA [Acidobacteriota bacterium]MCW5971303.1 tRNA pseudouridine(38-40) synthase TruA [Blastocatellales bacterium]
MQTWKLTLEYDGTRYSGWQEQPHSRTVQGELRRAAEDLFQSEVDLGGAGRTDAGVHARAQVAHLRVQSRQQRIEPTRLVYGINDRLPADINVLNAEAAPPGFNARRDAVARSYVYQISTRRTAFFKKYVWWVRDRLDVKAMQGCAQLVVGRRDFAAFCERDPKRDASTVVVVEAAEIALDDNLILFRITASHFLWKMVRRLAGAMVEVGRGNADPGDFEALLKNPKRRTHLDPARATAPPSGLFLERIDYRRR